MTRAVLLSLCLASGCMHLPGTPDRPFAEIPGDDTQPAPVATERIAGDDTQPPRMPKAVGELTGDRRK